MVKQTNKPETFDEAIQNLRSSGADLLFELAKEFKILWLVERIPQLQYREWVQRRMK